MVFTLLERQLFVRKCKYLAGKRLTCQLVNTLLAILRKQLAAPKIGVVVGGKFGPVPHKIHITTGQEDVHTLVTVLRAVALVGAVLDHRYTDPVIHEMLNVKEIWTARMNGV